jgi:hypothetical protein
MSDIFGIGGTAQAVGSVASAGIQSAATQAAAADAEQAANHATDTAHDQYETTRGDLMPYQDAGVASGLTPLNQLDYNYSTPDDTYVDAANTDFTNAAQIGQGPNGEAALAATPGYQFSLQQGEQAAQNSAAARGLGVSGAALKGAATFATGLADNTYQQQFQDAVANGTNELAVNTGAQGNLTNTYNRLMGTASLGENAAAMTGTAGTAAANTAASAITSGGAAAAAGTIGTGNALSSGVNGLANAYSQNQALLAQQQMNGSYGSSGGAWDEQLAGS